MTAPLSMAEQVAALPLAERQAILAQLSEEESAGLLFDWRFLARPSQLAPDGNWLTWLILSGRGFGKTRSGAEWIRSKVCGPTPLTGAGARFIALVAETAADGRDVMVEGESGLLAVHPKDMRPNYQSSIRRLTWPNGAVAHVFNATEPDQLRGPSHDTAWSDELAKWQYAQETWDNLQFGLRLGIPQQVVTTTPRPIPTLKAILADSSTVLTRGDTFENASNLAPAFLRQIKRRYEGTRLGRQELNAEILDDAPDALWRRAELDQYRRKHGDVPELKRVVVAVDPPAKENATPEDGAACGIVVAGLGSDNRGYVLHDGTCRKSPHGWAKRAVSLFHTQQADLIVGEVNQGGDMVKATVQAANPNVPFKAVRATRGKYTRAEPIAALYEQGKVSHVGNLPELEDEMVSFGPNGMVGGYSPDRVDALVWALTELFPEMTRKAPRMPVTHEPVSNWNPHNYRYGVGR